MESHPPPFRRFASKRFNATTISTEPQSGPPSDDIISGLSDMNISKHSWMSRSKSHKHHDSHIRTQPALRDAKSTLDMKASQQSRWRGVPLAFRPSEWLEPETSRKPTAPDQDHARSQSALPPRTSPPKQRRRPEPLRSISGGCRDPTCVTNSAPLAAPLVFPQYSPYNDVRSVYSAPDPGDHYPQLRSQPNTPSFYPHTQQDLLEERPASTIPRSSLFPPYTAGSTNPANDSDLSDDEFHLFAEATAGLGPEQAFRNSFQPATPSNYAVQTSQPYQPTSPPQHRTSPPQHRTSPPHHRTSPPQHHPSPSQPLSPLIITPTTRTAIQHIAQMPEAWSLPSRPRSPPHRPSVSPSRNDEAWLNPPVGTNPDDYNVSPIEDEDELPDYASSQAQAQEVQRAEAARRARELRRAWEKRNS
ncbi:unnamed protein product [Zymoseptoria tritici ST99CH_1E4]|uniref:Uncharacterized protein n=1 Tax=Zymoseptoria tritici ST99CH_1E4 TaxID=1276532 RepID=A0A2H1FLM6_ZYMTR|nr:unnamed protein product [Zymoseptoria tritici ST99CH_1E4]